LVDKRQRVMIFPSGFIQFPEIDHHPIASNNPLWDQFILIIRDNGNASLLRDTMHQTHPITMSNRLDNTRFQEL